MVCIHTLVHSRVDHIILRSPHVEVLVLDCCYDVFLMLPPLQLVRAQVLHGFMWHNVTLLL